ncbi:MAG: calcium/sodium antiporter [Rhodothermales bacterium]
MTLFLAVTAVLVGLAVLIWSADKFVDGASDVARHFHVSPLVIGMIIIGFGTSAPEMVVSLFASIDGNPGIALGNAYGSNIANLGLILGITALLSPIAVQSRIVRQELPILTAVTLVAAWIVWDATITRVDALLLLALFGALLAWSFRKSAETTDALQEEMDVHADVGVRTATIQLVVGLLLLIVSSRALVWGSVEIAGWFGVSDLVIGLTVVAIGTSLPELASSVAAARKGKHDMAIGNVIGSNLFNTLVVVGLAGLVAPFDVPDGVLTRDVAVMGAMTVGVMIFGAGLRRPGRINRWEGATLVATWIVYSVYLVFTA